MALPSGIITAKPGLGKAQKANLAPRDKRLLWPTARPDAEKRSAGVSRESLLTTITDLGKTSRIIVDSADTSSYPGDTPDTQVFTNIGTSSTPQYYLGASGSGSTDDPTFVGSYGDMSGDTYFSFDGGDLFKSGTTVSSITWLDRCSFSAYGVFTACVIEKHIDVGNAYQFLWSTNGDYSSTDRKGVSFLSGNGADYLAIFIGQFGGWTDVFSKTTNVEIGEGPRMLAVSIDNQTGTGFFYKNGSYMPTSAGDTFSVSFSSNSDSSSNKPALGASGRTSGPYGWVADGTKIYSGFMDDTAWTKEELDGIWAKVGGWLEATG